MECTLFTSAPNREFRLMNPTLPPSWQSPLAAELEKPYFQNLCAFVDEERSRATVFPPEGQEFTSLELTPYDAVKVLILGQDPYVLLLNAVLTVREGEPNSHKGQGWETFTDAVIRALAAREDPVVFVLWGGYAAKKETLIGAPHYVHKSAHPSPLSAKRGFFGSTPFTIINRELKRAGKTPVDWCISDG
jgi:uracil-DNA glycosylase